MTTINQLAKGLEILSRYIIGETSHLLSADPDRLIVHTYDIPEAREMTWEDEADLHNLGWLKCDKAGWWILWI